MTTKNVVYIIPGWGETGEEKRYQKLGAILEAKGYKVKRIKPDWYKTFSENVFEPEQNSIIIGFSYGACIAYRIAKKYPIQKVIFCSLSPLSSMSYKQIYSQHLNYMNTALSAKNAKDIKSVQISLETLIVPYVTLAGELEKIKTDFLVPKTGHFMSKNYSNAIVKLV